MSGLARQLSGERSPMRMCTLLGIAHRARRHLHDPALEPQHLRLTRIHLVHMNRLQLRQHH